ncbi:hypothetical protein DNTS_024158 [Danionella cerebrum]|uniref:G-protein coupled receptors family 1 profile domain-containing protein n=1 Tax=Danionella cerebrum TaxID=2873325 RepID=A0A553RIH5_9TELE|nr:hypothetical protein DNTS_024158 [Danionella translucida]
MSWTNDSSLSNKTSLNVDAEPNGNLLFGLSIAIISATLLGGVYSLSSLARMAVRSSLCLIIASLSIDDLISVVPLALFVVSQWRSAALTGSGVICTLSGCLYVFQGLSSNMKASLIVGYTSYVTRRFGVHQSPRQALGVSVALLVVWTASLVLSILPASGWGRIAPSSIGCLPETRSSYVLLLFAVHSLCLCGLLVCSVPLVHQLMCSAETWRIIHPGDFEVPSQSHQSLERSLGAYSEFSSKTGSPFFLSSGENGRLQKHGARRARDSPLVYSQKCFSVILAIARMLLWTPMMIQILLSHLHMHSSSLETPCFLLSLLSPLVTPVFMLSERWVHLPCGCFISCHRGVGSELSNGFGISKSSHGQRASFNGLYSGSFSESRERVLDSVQSSRFSAVAEEDGSFHHQLLLEESLQRQPLSSSERDRVSPCDLEDLHLDDSSVFDGPERRRSHEECQKFELTDWEWCRSKSERTPRQKSMAGLAIPICAFQGTVSLQAPTGKTLSLSTYEVSSDGLKISPSTVKKCEVYRSKSVGHEPCKEEPDSSSGSGKLRVADTNVKIRLEVLEICNNEEALDSVSIISNISQSSTHARSPSLRYSRRENRFVSCDLGESASYSLIIPTRNPDEDPINIHIPDTVEAHRQNSRKQHQEAKGYQEEIQLLNEAYRRQEREQGD